MTPFRGVADEFGETAVQELIEDAPPIQGPTPALVGICSSSVAPLPRVWGGDHGLQGLRPSSHGPVRDENPAAPLDDRGPWSYIGDENWA